MTYFKERTIGKQDQKALLRYVLKTLGDTISSGDPETIQKHWWDTQTARADQCSIHRLLTMTNNVGRLDSTTFSH